MKDVNSIWSAFDDLSDPRRDLSKLHELNDILYIVIIGVICGANTWNEIELIAQEKEDFLRQFLKLEHGIPSHDTLNRVFSMLDPESFANCFSNWVATLAKLSNKEVIAIDGKTIRGAKAHGKKSSIHLVSAWACKSNLCLGQVKTTEKSNEITAIPKLLEMLSIKGTIVTIDAMGCQKDIAKSIIKNKADYILSVKANQSFLQEEVISEFEFQNDISTHQTIDVDHGRIETRTCRVISDLDFIDSKNQWKNMKSIIQIKSQREFKNSDKLPEIASRYYISSLEAKPDQFQKAIRDHWSIENKLHWALDVSFNEDSSRKRAGNSASNLSIISKLALNLLINDKTIKIGVKGKRLKAAMNQDYLKKILKL